MRRRGAGGAAPRGGRCSAAGSPGASLAGRNIGQDFAGKDGWRMYHGDVVPGFPQHPHRGFETVTIVRRGLVDHADSLGAAARYGLRIGERVIPARQALELRADAEAHLENGPDEAELLMLQGRPIGEPVVQHGPFVMNSPSEIQQAFADYQKTRFGGWPWPSDGPVHGHEDDRFARHADGRIERAT